MKDAIEIFRFLIAAQTRGEQTALVTLVDVIGGSSRSTGTHMGVSETGGHIGAFSGGCVEAAIAGEARRIISAGRGEIVRFGVGSPFFDIRLPCGGGLDVLITPSPPAALCSAVVDGLLERNPVALGLSVEQGLFLCDPSTSTGWRDDCFHVRHDPALRLLIIGHGNEILSLARMGHAYGADIAILSPDAMILSAASALGFAAEALKTPTQSVDMPIDSHTAVIFLFHDHDWEAGLMAQALWRNPFFIGAMGSRKTQQARQETLEKMGVADHLRSRVQGPIGLIPATRDPDTLAVSILAEVVERHAIFCAFGAVQTGNVDISSSFPALAEEQAA